ERKGKIRSRIPGIFLFSFSGASPRGQGSAPSPARDTATAASRFARPGNTGVIYLLSIREIPIPGGPREAIRLVAVWDRRSKGGAGRRGLRGGQLPKAGQRRGSAPGLLTRRFGLGHGGDNGIDIVELLLEVVARLLIMSLHGVDPAVSRSQQRLVVRPNVLSQSYVLRQFFAGLQNGNHRVGLARLGWRYFALVGSLVTVTKDSNG